MASPTLIQSSALSKTTGGSEVTQQFIFSGAAPAGSTPILSFANYPGGAPTGVTDNQGNTYTKAVGISYQDNLAEIWYCSNIVSDGVTPLVITATFSANGNYTTGMATIWSGLNGVDKTVAAGNDTGGVSQTLTMAEANSQANVLAMMVGVINGGWDDSGLGISSPGWTVLWRENNSNSYEGGQSAYRIVNSIETTSVTQTSTIGSPINAAMATFKVQSSSISLTGQGGTQSNTAASPSIGQTHLVASSPSSQQNAGGLGAIGQVHITAQSPGAQQNSGASASVSLAHTLAVAASSQAQSASTGVIAITHVLAAASGAQANSAGMAAVSLAQLLSADPVIQANQGQPVGITLTLTLTRSLDSQVNAGDPGAIAQIHLVGVAQGDQSNASSSVSIGVTQDFTADADDQANGSADSSITQVHITDAAAADQSNESSSASILIGVFAIQESTFVAVVPARRYLASVPPQSITASVPPGRYVAFVPEEV